jgi:hypothetical protein
MDIIRKSSKKDPSNIITQRLLLAAHNSETSVKSGTNSPPGDPFSAFLLLMAPGTLLFAAAREVIAKSSPSDAAGHDCGSRPNTPLARPRESARMPGADLPNPPAPLTQEKSYYIERGRN